MANSRLKIENVNMIELNCKVVKKVATPHFYINPHFQVYPPLLANNFVPQVTQFQEGPTPPLPHPPPLIREGGSNYDSPTNQLSKQSHPSCNLLQKHSYYTSDTATILYNILNSSHFHLIFLPTPNLASSFTASAHHIL